MDNSCSETFVTYETVNKGTYVCMQCGGENQSGIITIKHRGEMLPECKECGYTTWLKVM
jgi:DNA-directed RNA polymerase subunit RPC12/RpoP